MRVIIQPDAAAAAKYSAKLIGAVIRRKPDLALGLATGRTPIKTYEELVRMHREDGLDFARVTTFNLDEYYGLPRTHPASYNEFMRKHLFSGVNVPPQNAHIPDGSTPIDAIKAYCHWYEEKINSFGGIGLQLLGIGVDGHIGFNEPGSSLASRTRLKTLSWETKEQNKDDFGGDPNQVPDCAITMGIGTIMDARMVLLLATGESKAEILAQALEGTVTSSVTASVLQMHSKVKVVVDQMAASRLKQLAYHQHVSEVRERLGYPEIDTEDIG